MSFLGCFARNIDGDSWFALWFNHPPGSSISPKRTPMLQLGCIGQPLGNLPKAEDLLALCSLDNLLLRVAVYETLKPWSQHLRPVPNDGTWAQGPEKKNINPQAYAVRARDMGRGAHRGFPWMRCNGLHGNRPLRGPPMLTRTQIA